MSVCLSVIKYFEITAPTVFVRFLRKLAHVIYVPIPKNWKRFSKFCFKNFWQIFKILCQQHHLSSIVVGLSKFGEKLETDLHNVSGISVDM